MKILYEERLFYKLMSKKTARLKRHHLWLLLIFASLLGFIFLVFSSTRNATHALSDTTQDTLNHGWIRWDNWLDQRINPLSGGTGYGHIGVDIDLQGYNPCHTPGANRYVDTFRQSCDDHSTGCSMPLNPDRTCPAGAQTWWSYYKDEEYWAGGSQFPYGIFVDNSNNGLTHYFARRLDAVFLEVYPHSRPTNNDNDYQLDPGACGCTVAGGYQVVVGLNQWNGGYSPNIGTIRVEAFGDPDVGKINGFVTRHGTPVGAHAVSIDWFGQDYNYTRSSTGYRVTGFASWPTNKDGYYTSGPLLNGNYHIYAHDLAANHTVECVGISLKGQGGRIDLELDRQHFGFDGPGRQCYDRYP